MNLKNFFKDPYVTFKEYVDGNPTGRVMCGKPNKMGVVEQPRLLIDPNYVPQFPASWDTDPKAERKKVRAQRAANKLMAKFA